MKTFENSFKSSDKIHDVLYSVWEPDSTPRAIFQISHGMCEHKDRYEKLAEYLCDNGIVCCINNHIGHGKNVSEDELGYFGKKGSCEYLTNDLDVLRQTIRQKYKRLPYIMFGHSMGSFVVRDYITKYANNIDAAIICGTAGTNKAIDAAIVLSNIICLFGRKKRSEFLKNLAFKGYNDRFPDEGEFGWLTRNKEIRDKYANDPLCGFTFTAGGYNELFRMIKAVSGPQWAVRVPISLPVLIIAGDNDPVGDYGKGPNEVYGLLEDRELCNLKKIIYENYRHEIHNEIDNEIVEKDIVNWINEIVSGVVECSTNQ